MQEPILDIIRENPTAADQKSVIDALRVFNAEQSGMSEDEPDFAVLLRDPDTGSVLGGLCAVDGYGWAFIKYLVVPQAYRGRGLGSRLVLAAEDIARARGYVGIWLDTFDFQARPFYEKMGYEIFGELPSMPGARARYFLRKQF